MNMSEHMKRIQELERMRDAHLKKAKQEFDRQYALIAKELTAKEQEFNFIYGNMIEGVKQQSILGDDEVVITSSHHFNDNVILLLTTEESIWTVEGNVVGPDADIADFIDTIFRFTGVCFDYDGTYNNYLKIRAGKNRQNLTALEVIRMIYERPLNKTIRFIDRVECPEVPDHMGCQSFTAGSVSNDAQYKTYGDILARIGAAVQYQGYTYYEYPDSVMLDLDRVASDDEICKSCDNKHYAPRGDLYFAEHKGDDTVYLHFSFGR